ncbi:unnamed protein product, partial [Polarella glacialis]
EEALVPDALSGQGSAQGIFIQARNGCEKMASSPEHVGHETDDPTMEHCSAACLSEATCAGFAFQPPGFLVSGKCRLIFGQHNNNNNNNNNKDNNSNNSNNDNNNNNNNQNNDAAEFRDGRAGVLCWGPSREHPGFASLPLPRNETSLHLPIAARPRTHFESSPGRCMSHFRWGFGKHRPASRWAYQLQTLAGCAAACAADAWCAAFQRPAGPASATRLCRLFGLSSVRSYSGDGEPDAMCYSLVGHHAQWPPGPVPTQEDDCKLPSYGRWCEVKLSDGRRFEMACYKEGHDFVCNHICGEGHWEIRDIQDFFTGGR